MSQIKLQTSNDEWHLPNSIHLSNSYKPKLSLQDDEAINSTLLFLNEKYLPNEIDKYFLTEIGVNDSFKFYTSELKRNEIPTSYRQKFESLNNYIVQNATQYGSQHRLLNHIDLNYKSLLSELKYSEIFWKEVKKSNSKNIKFLFQESTYRTAFNSVSFENFVVNYLKQNATLPNQENDLKKPTELFSFLLSEYITDKNDLPKFDLSKIHINNDQSKSLEDILGVQKLLSEKHCVELLSRTERRISHEQITALQIVKILSSYTPTDVEKTKLFLLNKNLEWKPLNKLFTSTEEQFQIDPTQHLHEDFYSIADNFGIQELSEGTLVLKTKPKTPVVTDEIETFFRSKAKFIAFKIDHSNYEDVETDIIEKIIPFEFYEVTSIAKVFPEVSPIYKTEIDFHFEEDENKVLYKGNWKTNDEIKDFLFQLLQHEKIESVWFENLINRWSDEEISKQLNDTVAPTPLKWDAEVTEEPDTFWKELTSEDEEFIKRIIKGNNELNEKLEANTAAKIKTLLKIKDLYPGKEISDEEYYLKVDDLEIIVRSAQNGLLFLDINHWDRFAETNVHLSVYTNNEVKIFENQEALFNSIKDGNKLGIIKMPDDYKLNDLNSVNSPDKKGVWRFVFIVNENTKAAQSYKEVMNLDDYNF